MNSGTVTVRVYDALKTLVMSTTVRPGARLDPARLAEDLASSATPVRDALYQLLGEGLVEARPGEGFFLPHLHETCLRTLYAWLGDLGRLALRQSAGPAASSAAILPRCAPYEARTRGLFHVLAASSQNAEHLRQMEALSDRLAAARNAETCVFADHSVEVQGLADVVAAGDRAAAGRMLAGYCRRRVKAVPDIIAARYGAAF